MRAGDRYAAAQYQGRQGLLDAISAAQQGFVRAEHERRRALASGASDAQRRQMELYPASPGTTAQLDTSRIGPDGGPVYRGPDGRYYDVNGNPVQAQPRQAEPAPFRQGYSNPLTLARRFGRR